MLLEIAVEVLHFLSRWDLDNACGISKWFDATVAPCCETYPLRLMHSTELLPSGHDFITNVVINADQYPGSGKTFNSIDEAVHFAASLLHLSHIEDLMVTYNDSQVNAYENDP